MFKVNERPYLKKKWIALEEQHLVLPSEPHTCTQMYLYTLAYAHHTHTTETGKRKHVALEQGTDQENAQNGSKLRTQVLAVPTVAKGRQRHYETN